jgi:hypothetical protein
MDHGTEFRVFEFEFEFSTPRSANLLDLLGRAGRIRGRGRVVKFEEDYD